ncbi:hypothetical protein OK016_16925 [Vibrio chagasii]|nr:hypothetical protein [Vibrio chagasii]
MSQSKMFALLKSSVRLQSDCGTKRLLLLLLRMSTVPDSFGAPDTFVAPDTFIAPELCRI